MSWKYGQQREHAGASGESGEGGEVKDDKDCKIGISFLQLPSDDFHERAAIEQQQLNAPSCSQDAHVHRPIAKVSLSGKTGAR